MNQAGDIELENNSSLEEWANDDPQGRDFPSLPPTDTGLQAWTLLGACFMIEALTWGFPFTFGLFESYYTQHEAFSSEKANVPVIGTTTLGIMYFSAPLLSYGLHQFPHLRRTACLVGLSILSIGLVIASFANSVLHLILTQGVLYGIGGGTLYFPAIHYIDEWFVRRKGFAYGVMWAGAGASGVVMPYVVDWLLHTYGFRTTLRSIAVAMVVLTLPLLAFLKHRVPLTARDTSASSADAESDSGGLLASSRARPLNWSFLTTACFWFFSSGNILLNLGFFLPPIYLPLYARSLHISSNPRTLGTTALSLVNFATVPGAVVMGYLIDRLHVTSVILLASLGAATSVLVLWGLALSPAMVYAFAIAYGIFAGGFSATWSGCSGALRTNMEKTRGQGAGANVDTGLVISVMAAGKGIGAVISGPLSTVLLDAAEKWHGSAAYGTSYGGIVTFTGVAACFGGLSWAGRMLGFV